MDKGNEQKTQNYIYIILRFIITLYYICHATAAKRWPARRGVGREFTTIIIIISVVLYIIMYTSTKISVTPRRYFRGGHPRWALAGTQLQTNRRRRGARDSVAYIIL